MGGLRPAVGQVTPYHEQVGYAHDLNRFKAEDYGGHTQNWAFVQDKRGIVYVANRTGILEFDSVRWRSIPMANGEAASALALSDSGTVFVGGKGEIGYLAPDSLGEMRYFSLVDRIPADKRDFLFVWNAHRTSQGIFFHTSARIYRWNGLRFDIWESERRLHTTFVVHDRYFVRTDGIGLQEISNQSLHPIAGGGLFADKRVVAMVPAGTSNVLVAAQQGIEGPLELYVMVEGDIVSIDVDGHLKSEKIAFYNGTALPGGYLALSTLGNGVFILRLDGTLIQILDQDYGVPRDGNSLYVDANGGLWIAHNSNGISRLNAPVALSEFGPVHGLPVVHDIIRYDDRLFTAGAGGVFRLKARELQAPILYNPHAFEELTEEALTAWSFAVFRDRLLVGSEAGILRLDGDRFRLMPMSTPVKNVRRLVASARYPDRLYVGMETGIGLLASGGGTARVVLLNEAIAAPVHSLGEEVDGTLWAVTEGKDGRALWRITFSSASDRTGQVERFAGDTLPWGAGKVILAPVDGMMRFVPGTGLFVFERRDDGTYRFVPDTLLTTTESADDALISVNQVDAHVWLVYRDRMVYARLNADGSYTHRTLDQIDMPGWEAPVSIYLDDHETLWIACGNRLYRYVEALDAGIDRSLYFEPIVRRVTIAAVDSLLLANAGASGVEEGVSLDLDSETNDLTFSFVLPEYSGSQSIEYKYRLEPYDNRWSDWTTETDATYRNVGAGTYQFRLQARTPAHLFAREIATSLRIRRPWFWSPWTWFIYSVLLATPFVLFIRYRKARRQLKDLERERIVNQRLNDANVQLRTANETLRQANKLKDEFLANASHELRTPLTAILGFTDVLKEEIPNAQLEFLELIDENGKRLLRTINSLLDLTKLRAGMLEVHPERIDVCEKAEELVDMMSQLARNKHLQMYVIRPEHPIYAWIDTHSFERIMYNLVGNAIKFTDAGEVSITVEAVGGHSHIRVRDTGVGISETFIPHLFTEFKQEPRAEGQPEGSGLGLAITAHLVDLMGGQITVESAKGEGSTFTVVFPPCVDPNEGWGAAHPRSIPTEASTSMPSS
jgi:signal transduction histidine kinase